jgi:hypothetical protein
MTYIKKLTEIQKDIATIINKWISVKRGGKYLNQQNDLDDLLTRFLMNQHSFNTTLISYLEAEIEEV